MAKPRPYVLSIAATDPSAGAGVLADIKTLEANKVYGLGVVSGITYQNDNSFEGVDWVPVENIIRQAEIVLTKFPVKVAKIGLIQSLPVLESVIDFLLQVKPDLIIIWGPILNASAGFNFHDTVEPEALPSILQKLFLLTPNVPEAFRLATMTNPEESALKLSYYCHVFLKGGHQKEKLGWDTLYLKSGEKYSYRPKGENITVKHGSGCVLSAALAANLAQDYKLPRACLRAKQYTTKFLSSNATLLGYHQS